MSKFTFGGNNTQEMLANAKGQSTEKKLSKLEKMAKEKSKNKKTRHSLYIDEEIMAKLYTVSMKTGVSVNDMILSLIEDEVKDVVIDEEKVVEYKYKNKAKGNRARKNITEEVNAEFINKTND